MAAGSDSQTSSESTSDENIVMEEQYEQIEQPGYRSTMIWDGYIYHRERTVKERSWWHCRRNRSRDKDERLCMGRAVYKNGSLVVTVEHSHGPESTSQNYIPSSACESTPGNQADLLSAVKGFVFTTDQDVLQSENFVSSCYGQTSRNDLLTAVKGFVLPTDQTLLQSEVTNVVKHHQCDLCGMNFAIARVLETHKMLEHQVYAEWKCSECGMQFLQASSLSLHINSSHPFITDRYDFANLSAIAVSEVDLQIHNGQIKLEPDEETVESRTNVEKTFLDPDTNLGEQVIEPSITVKKRVSKRRKNNVQKEVELSKKMEKPVYKCQACPAEFPHPCKLKVHMRKHTGEKPYKCNLCPKTFMTGSRRGAHLKSAHSNVRQYLCDWCGKKFTSRNCLGEHVRTHTGEKPYSCPVCARQFSKRHAMVVHKRQHTGEKPYVCDQCGQSFTVNVSLRSHLKSKHNIIVDTSVFARVVKPGDIGIPAIGRPKRKDAEKQLFVNIENGQKASEHVQVTVNSGENNIDSSGILDNYKEFSTSFSDGDSAKPCQSGIRFLLLTQ